jgi:hypothetical protein
MKAGSFKQASLMRRIVGIFDKSHCMRCPLATCGTKMQSAKPGASPKQN